MATKEQLRAEAEARARMRMAQSKSQPQSPGVGGTIVDAAKGLGSGVIQGVASIPDMVTMAGRGLAYGAMGTADLATNLVTGNDPNLRGNLPPVMEQPFRENTPGANFEPQTPLGRGAQTVGTFAVNAAVPGTAMQRAAAVAAPAIGQEIGGALMGEGPLQPVGEIVGAVGGALSANGLARETTRLIRSAAKAAEFKTGPEMKKVVDTAYRQLRQAGITYNADNFSKMVSDAKATLIERGYHPSIADQAHKVLDDLAKNPTLDFGALDAQSSAIGKAARTAYIQGNDALGDALDVVRSKLDNFAVRPNLAADVMIDGKRLATMRADARKLVLRKKKAETVEGMIEMAEAAQTGFVQGLNNEIARELRKAAKGDSIFNKSELDLLKSVQSGQMAWQRIPALFGVSNEAFGGVALSAGTVGRLTQGPSKRTKAGQLATAMRNERLREEALKAKEDTYRRTIRQLLTGNILVNEAVDARQ